MGSSVSIGGAAPAPQVHEPELDPAFEVLEPATLECPLVFSSPHSGSIYPRRFLDSARLDAMALRRSEDAFVDDLFACAVAQGAPLLRARFPRAYLDLNREPYELDPRMFEGRLPGFVNTRSVRVAGGLGTVARLVGDSQEIYAGRLDVDEVLARVERLYKPYHATLRCLLDRAHRHFGHALLVDCHSMPSMPSSASVPDPRRQRTDFVIGDRYGTSADVELVDALEQAMIGLGYAVQRNKPYAGGYITEHYGAPPSGFHAIQIEVNRAIYMDERRMERTARFGLLQEHLATIVAALAAAVNRHVERRMRPAAE